jgi:uncharacterized membrane protein YfcA
MIFISGFWIVKFPVDLLKIILGMILVAGGIVLWGSAQRPVDDCARIPLFFGPPLMAVIGSFCGISGVTGGAFETFIMMNFLGVPSHMAVGTTAVSVLISSVLGSLGRLIFYIKPNPADYSIVSLICAAAFLGGCLGPKISVRIEKRLFRNMFSLLIILWGIVYIIQALYTHGNLFGLYTLFF